MHIIEKPPDKIAELKSWLTVDPGLNGHTGWALWDNVYIPPLLTGITKAWPHLHWEDEARHTALEVRAKAKYHDCKLVVTEMPEFWSGSAKSFASAAQGSLFKLSFLVGCIHAALDHVPIKLIAPRTWKGQLKKDMVNRRIKAAIDLSYPDHISDAVGMGLFMKGKL